MKTDVAIAPNPTVRRLIDLFDPIQRHEIHAIGEEPTIVVVEHTQPQRRLLRLLRLPMASCGHPTD